MLMLIPLSLAVYFACLVEASLGFGSTILTLALASYWFEVQDLIAILIPINLFLSAYLTFKYYKQIEYKILLIWVLPWAGLGFVLSLRFLSELGAQSLKGLFGVLIFCLGLWQLFRLFQSKISIKPRPFLIRALTLIGAGITQGLFASGGPLMVTELAASIPNKGRLRSSLSCTWLVMNLVLFVHFTALQKLTPMTTTYSAWLIPATLLGMLTGTYLHSRIPERQFRMAVYALLAVSGVFLGYSEFL